MPESARACQSSEIPDELGTEADTGRTGRQKSSDNQKKTAGILDGTHPEEVDWVPGGDGIGYQWLESIGAGNLYINGSTTGAIVLRQPVGGMGCSAFRPGIKAGGPDYVAQRMDFEPHGDPRTDPQIADPPLAFSSGAASPAGRTRFRTFRGFFIHFNERVHYETTCHLRLQHQTC